MLKINIAGTVTSKRAAHVPVFRKWRLVWERREFGTQVDRIERTYQSDHVSFAQIPKEGLTLGLGKDFDLSVVPLPDEDGVHLLRVALKYEGGEVPGTRKVLRVPELAAAQSLRFNKEVYKGVVVDLRGSLTLHI